MVRYFTFLFVLLAANLAVPRAFAQMHYLPDSPLVKPPFIEFPSLPIGTQKEFWVWDLNVMPPGSRKITATLVESGVKTYIFVENSFPMEPAFLSSLRQKMESSAPVDSAFSKLGIIPMQEKIFNPLPQKITQDNHLIILFANLGKFKEYEFDGFYNPYDQLTEEEAQKDNQHSNQANIIYINGLRKDEDYTTGVISHELQHLLASGATSDPEFHQDLWLSETLAEGAMLLSGYFTDQGHLDAFTKDTGKFPLVSSSYVQYGPQLLFSSFLLDSVKPGWSALGYLTKLNVRGRDAIETLYRQKTETPLSFDAIFSNFISYIFENQTNKTRLPQAWYRPSGAGLLVNEIKPFANIPSFPAQIEGSLYPYSFVTIDLAQALPSTAVVKVELLPSSASGGDPSSCASTSNVLWKPITTKKIVIYAVGCEHKSKSDLVRFRLKILDRALLLSPSPIKISL